MFNFVMLNKKIIFYSGKKNSVNYSTDGDQGLHGKCEACGNVLDEQNMKVKKDKRFCSTICAKS